MHLHDAISRYIHWLANAKSLSDHTIRAYSSDMGLWSIHSGPTTDVRNLTAHDLLTFVEDQRSSGMAERTILRRITAIRGFYSWILETELTHLETHGIEAVRARRQKTLPRVATTQDVRLLHQYLRQTVTENGKLNAGVRSRPHQAATLLAVSLMLATGTRIGETTGIECSNIDLHAGSIRVRGKGSRDRVVYLPDEWLQELLAAYLDVRNELGITHPYLLSGQAGNPMKPSTIRLRLIDAGKAAGVGDRVTPHMLRHAAATQLLEAGVDIRFVQRLLGHASITTTELYTHVSDIALRRAITSANVLQRDFMRDN